VRRRVAGTSIHQSPFSDHPNVAVVLNSRVAVDDVQPGVRNLAIGIAAGGGAAVVVLWFFGGWVPALFVGVLVLSALGGLWRGGAEIAGSFAGLLLALLVAPALGRMFEGTASSLTGSHGVLNRIVSTLIVGLVVVAICSGVLGWLVKRWMRERESVRQWNRIAGGAIGAAHGLVLALVALWVPLTLRNIAYLRIQADEHAAIEAGMSVEEARARASPLARRVLAIADAVRSSGLGLWAEGLNPIDGLEVIELAHDFAAITRDEAAKERLANSDAWKRMESLRSFEQARKLVESDPSLKAIIDAEGVTVSSMRTLLDSPTVLRVMDETTLAADLAALKDDLVAAIKQARGR